MVYKTGRLLGLKSDSINYDLVCGGIDGFVYDKNGVLRAVNVNWNDDGWNVNANSVENPNDWNAGNRVFSEIIIFSLVNYESFLSVILFSNRLIVDQFLLT